MKVRLAGTDDLATYTAFARSAQEWLRSKNLEQYVPAAHDEYADALRAQAAAGTLYSAWDRGEVVGYFNLDTAPSPWWPAADEAALYLAGMVVAQHARGRGVGGHIIQWCVAEAGRRGRSRVRLDCHAGNRWLRSYYEKHGFVLRGRVEQHPGYFGCLYELRAPPPTGDHQSVLRALG
jgi:GNAT superfamily N-acetyltransferase